MKLIHRPLRSLLHLLLASVLFSAHAVHANHAEVTDLLKNNRPKEALTALDKRLRADPQDPQLRFLQGVAQAMDNQTKEAINTFTKLSQEYPDLPEPHNNLAVLYANQNQLDKSREALERAIRTNPSYSTAHENLGDIYAKLASQAYSKALQLDNKHASSINPKLALIHELFTSSQGTAQALAGTTTTSKAAAPAVPATASPPVAAVAVAAAPPAAPAALTAPTAPTTPTRPESPASPAEKTPPAATNTTVASTTATATAATSAAPAGPATSNSPATADSRAVAAVQDAVQAWATAWAAQDMKNYLAAYGRNFQTPGKQSRAAWEKERQARIMGKAHIRVELSDLQITVGAEQATARFHQSYKANNFSSNSRKTLVLEKQQGQWVIVRETVGG